MMRLNQPRVARSLQTHDVCVRFRFCLLQTHVKTDKKDESKAKDTTNSRSASNANGTKEDKAVEKVKSNKETSKSPLRVPSTQNLQLKLTRLEKDDKTVVTSPMSTTSNGTEDKKKTKTTTATTSEGEIAKQLEICVQNVTLD